MSRPIESYALIGDLQTAALVSDRGSIDWLCFPRFDSPACFAALLGDERHGRWQIAPVGDVHRTSRRYVGDTLILETTFETDDGTVRLTDLMPVRERQPDVVRIVEGVSGCVEMCSSLHAVFAYGDLDPWIERIPDGIRAIGGPDAVELHTVAPVESLRPACSGRFRVSQGDRVGSVLTWHPSHEHPPEPIDPFRALDDTRAWWEDWSSESSFEGEHSTLVMRSLITLKALTYAPTGGVIAAPTTSLPERIGGVRNWDYRFCWVRDATFTLQALLAGGYQHEAIAWRDWLLRALAGEPGSMQILYGAGGERLVPEVELPWLPGYERSAPVRVGNAAARQFQLDVYGELMDVLHQARISGIEPMERAWDLQRVLMDFVASHWREPDEGIWEVRSERQHFTHSKVMAWVAADRAAKAVERFELPGDAEAWRSLADEIRAEVCARGFNEERNTFTQVYGGTEVDAALLMIPLVGFLPADDPRVVGTVEAVGRDLCSGGLVSRYRSEHASDGLPHGEGTFLPCSFWYADALAAIGRDDEARAVFTRLVGLANDVGLYAEEYDVAEGRFVGNFPQALTHIALVTTANNLFGAPSRRDR